MSATEFFVEQYRTTEAKAQVSTHVDLEGKKRSALRLLDEFYQGKIDLDVHFEFEDGVLVFPDGLRLAFHSERGDTFSSPTSFFRVQGQCPNCGEACWSIPCYAASRIGEMLVAFRHQNHKCPIPAGKRPIGIGDVVSVELGDWGGEISTHPVEVLRTPRGGGSWQFSHDGNVYALSTGAAFLITRTDKTAIEEVPF